MTILQTLGENLPQQIPTELYNDVPLKFIKNPIKTWKLLCIGM
jgi:hypothetical protein